MTAISCFFVGASLVNGSKRHENHMQPSADSFISNAMGYMYRKCV